MPAGVELGAGFFNLGLEIGGFTKNMAGLGASVAGGVGKVVPGVGKMGESFARADDKIGGVMRSVERFSRGIRGSTPELAHANEQVYRYQDSLKGLQAQMEITKIRIQERIQAEKNNAAQIATSQQKLAQYAAAWQTLDAALRANQAQLVQMLASGTATAADLKKQEDAVGHLETALDKLEKKQRQESAILAEAEGNTQKLALQRQRAEQVLNQQQQAESRYGSLLDMAKERIQKVSDRLKERAEKQKLAKAATDAAMQSDERHGGILSRLFGLFHSGGGAVQSFGQAEQRSISIQNAFNASMMKTSSILRDIAVGSIGSFIGNTLSSITTNMSGLVTTGLDAYKSYELLGQSLTALSARELVATGKFKDLGAAQASAGQMSVKLIDWMQQLAILSPFSVEDISGAFRLGNALGFTAKQTQLLIKDTTDWASATGASGAGIESVIRALGQMHNTGHVTLEDVNQLTDAGLGARDILRKEFAPEIKRTGKTLEELISAGLIPADRAINAVSMSLEHDFKDGAKNAGSSMTGLINSIGDLKNTALREFFTSTFETVKPMVAGIVDMLQNPNTLASIQGFGQMIGSGIGEALNWVGTVAVPTAIEAFQTFGPMVMDAVATLGAVAQEAYAWGYNVGQMFSQGLSDTLDSIMSVVSWIGNTLAEWLAPGSPPKIAPEIDIWGRKAMQEFYNGMQMADAETPLQQIQHQVADGLAEITRHFGTVAPEVQAYTDAMLAAAQANQAVSDAQDELNTVTKEYDDRLAALKAQQDALTAAGEAHQLDKQIAVLESQLAATNPAGMGQDKFKIQNELDKLRLQKKINAAEQEKKAAVDAEQAKLDAAKKVAEAAQVQLDFQTKMIAQAQEQNQLIRDEIDLLSGKKKTTSEEQAEEDRKAKAAYEFKKMSTADQIKSLEAQQAQQRAGSKEWYDIQEQIDQKKEELNKKITETSSRADTAEAKAQKAEEQRHHAEYEARLAAANTEEERLQIMQEEQSRFAVGSTEYLKIQANIEKQKDKVAKASDKQLKAQQQLSDAEFEADLAGKSRAEQIQMLHERMNGLTEGSLEYEKVRKRINTLEGQEARAAEHGGGAGGGKGHKPKPGGIGGGGPLRELQDMTSEAKNVTSAVGKIGGAFSSVGERVATIRARIAPFFNFLREHSQIISFVLQRLVTSFAIGLIITRVVQPLLQFVWGLRQFITWGNVAWLALIALGYAWKTNFGGIRDIAAKVWEQIQSPLKGILELFNRVKAAFTEGGLQAGISELLAELPNLGQAILSIGQSIFSGIGEWITPFLNALSQLAQGAIAWVQGGGLARFFTSLTDSITNFFSSAGGEGGFLSSGAIVAGILGLVGGLQMVVGGAFQALMGWLSEHGPGLLSGIGRFLQEKIPVVFGYLMAGLALALSGLMEGLIPTLFFLVKRLLDVAAWLLPMIPDLLSGLMSGISILLAWLIGRGGPLLIGGLVNLVTYLFNKLAEMGPNLGLKVGMFIGSTLTKLVLALAAGIGMLFAQLWLSIQDGSFWTGLKNLGTAIGNFLLGAFNTIGGLIIGLVLGLFQPLADVGRDLLLGLGAGIDTGFTTLIANFVAWFDSLVQAAKDLLGIASPSSLFFQIATDMIQGLVNGIVGMLSAVRDGFNQILGVIGGFVTDGVAWFLDLTTRVAVMVAAWLLDLFGKFGVSRDQVIGVITEMVNNVTEWWTTLKTDVLQLATDIWDGIVGASGWITRLVADFTQFCIDLWGAITGNSGSFTKLKADILQLAQDIWNGIVGAGGWIAKLLADGIQLITDLASGIVGPDGIFTRFKTTILTIGQSIWDGLVGPNGIIAKLGTDMVVAMATAVGGAQAVLQNFAGWIINSVDGLLADMANGGRQLGNGLLNAITSALSDGWSSVTNWVQHRLQSFIDSLVSSVTGGGGGGNEEAPPELASGTRSARGGMTLVGEHGPELVMMPHAARVFSHSDTQSLFTKGMAKLSDQMAALTQTMGDRVQGFMDRAVGAIDQAIRSSAAQMATAQITNQTTNNDNRKYEDHYHMTVKTMAAVPTVVQDFGIMRTQRRIH